MEIKKNISAPRHVLVAVLSACFLFAASPVFGAGIPTVDGPLNGQAILIGAETLAQGLKQIEQYNLQFQQYQDQIKNTDVPPMYIWAKAQETMTKLQGMYNLVGFYTQQAGSVDSYLRKFMSPSEYFQGQDFEKSRARAAEGEWAALEAQSAHASGVLRSLEDQDKQLRADAATIERLQQAAESAEGRMAALQYANQFAAQLNSQMIQLRSVLSAQQAVIAAQAKLQEQEKLSRDLMDKHLLGGTPEKVQPIDLFQPFKR